VAFIGSCTNGRRSDFEAVVEVLIAGRYKVAPHVQALVVPGSMQGQARTPVRGAGTRSSPPRASSFAKRVVRCVWP